MDFEEKLKALGFSLPKAPKPVANYLPVVRSGSLLFLSGMLPWVDGKFSLIGKLGRDLNVDQGQEAARMALLNGLSIVKTEIGSLQAISKIVRMVVHVASDPEFTRHALVANGASDLLVEVFGETGRHARLALGASSLPLNSPLELELIIEVPITPSV